MANAKATALLREIKAALAFRTTLSIGEVEFNADGNPELRVGAAAANAAGALMRIEPQDWPEAEDILGNAATTYVPLVAKIGFEANEEGATAQGDINTLATITPLLGELIWRGLKVEVYVTAEDDNPDSADLDDASLLIYTWNPSPVHGMIAGQ